MSAETRFLLNGQEVAVTVRPDMTVLDLLRNELGLNGTKEGCAEGDCGACTVLLERAAVNGGKRMAANSCIMTVSQLDGASVTTVEGLKQDGLPSALQVAMAKNGSSQCGFCTPGIVLAATGLLDNNPQPEEDDIHDALAGNLCRCTGYRPIVEAVRDAASEANSSANGIALPNGSDVIAAGGATVHRPSSLRGFLRLRSENPDAIILAGSTDLGVRHAAYETNWSDVISTDRVKEMRQIKVTDAHFHFGAAATWEEVLNTVAEDYPSFATLIRRFGSTQIRSMGTIGGNVGTASPIGDGPPALIALGAEVTLASLEGGSRTIPLEDFFLDYRKTALRSDEAIVAFDVPRAKPSEHFRVWKISKRYDQDISTVCGAFWLRLEGDTVSDVRIAFGGMAAIPKRATAAEAVLKGKTLSADVFLQAAEAIKSDYQPLSDWRGSADYRIDVASGLVLRLERDLAGERVEVMA